MTIIDKQTYLVDKQGFHPNEVASMSDEDVECAYDAPKMTHGQIKQLIEDVGEFSFGDGYEVYEFIDSVLIGKYLTDIDEIEDLTILVDKVRGRA